MNQQKEEVQLIKVSDGLFVRQEIDNIGWVDMGDSLMVVDALEHAELADEVISLFQETVPGRKVGTVLNTHTHYDHVALNGVFAKKYDAEIVNFKTRHIPEDGLLFEGGERTCRFIPMPGAHTREDCIAWFAEDHTLFVGDLFGWGLITSMTSATIEVMTGLEAIYNKLIDFEADTVVPGHGPLCTNQELIRCRDYYAWLTAKVYAAVDDNQHIGDIVESIPVPEDMQHWWRLTEWKHERNIRKLVKGAKRGRTSRRAI